MYVLISVACMINNILFIPTYSVEENKTDFEVPGVSAAICDCVYR